MTIVLGIDIGVTGAIAAVDSRGSCQIIDIPTLQRETKSKFRRVIDPRALILALRDIVPPGEQALALIEDVHAMPGVRNSPQSTFGLGHSRGIIEAVLSIARFDLRTVQPSAWKRHFGLIGKDKTDALPVARELYPMAEHMLKRQKDHNRADSLLIAHYGRTLL